MSLKQVALSAVVLSVFTGGIAFIFIPLPILVFLIMVASAYAPITLIRARARQNQKRLRQSWPEVIEHLSSAVRAGLSLPEAVAQLSTRGPVQLRPAFSDFAADYRVTGNFSASVDRLKLRLADPIADRVLEALRLARDVGGSNLSALLRNLTSFLHDDLRTRGEIAARQSWTIAGSRLAVAAPWLILMVLSTRAEAAQAYRTSTGTTLILVSAAVTLIAYRVMVKMGRLPTEDRVLR
ncbi:MAG TPA: type II secretion system F family protein [Actinomycetales bacterium]|nr:type II secretion system F family protein [Actinomycetales bacterium]